MNRRNVIVVGLLFCACVCSANTIVVDAYASGWYDQRGYSFGRSGSNLVGLNYLGDVPYTYNTFYIFTIPALGADVAGVTSDKEEFC